jgi:hypothetical protein
MAANRYVRPARGGWDVVKEGHRRGTERARTKAEAIRRAREIARREGGGEIRIMNRQGKVTATDTVAPRPARSSR